MAKMQSGREREFDRILRANKASAVGRLMLGEFRSWRDFFEAGEGGIDVSLPRKKLKAGYKDVQRRLSKEIKNYCHKNFTGMTEEKLAGLYEEIKTHKGLELPLEEFKRKYAEIESRVLQGVPRHATVVISLWWMQFNFPEDNLAKDIIEALTAGRDAESRLKTYESLPHYKLTEQREEVAALVRKSLHAARSCILSCFNLVEAYLNGLAWDLCRDPENIDSLSKRKREQFQGVRRTTFRFKLLEYPKIISGKPLWNETDEPVSTFLSQVKPFRDSLVHPSPFSTPEKFGGYDTLKNLYRIDADLAKKSARLTCEIIVSLDNHCRTEDILPIWLADFKNALESLVTSGAETGSSTT